MTGLGGALFAAQNAFIASNIFTFDLSILMLLFVILSGLGTVRPGHIVFLARKVNPRKSNEQLG